MQRTISEVRVKAPARRLVQRPTAGADRLMTADPQRAHRDDELGGDEHLKRVDRFMGAAGGDRCEARVRLDASGDRHRLGGDRSDERAHLGCGRVCGVLDNEGAGLRPGPLGEERPAAR